MSDERKLASGLPRWRAQVWQCRQCNCPRSKGAVEGWVARMAGSYSGRRNDGGDV